MHPVYGCMDSHPQAFPHHIDQIPYPQHYYPSWPPVKVDTAKVPSTFGPWSYTSSFNNAGPTECNGCCSHPYPPGYYSFRPPHPHVQPPQMFYHGPYPPYPNAYPAYFTPPPHYSVDQAQYDYENPRGQHCCGCPNHTCHQKKDGNSLRIEKHKPEAESKSADSSPLIRLPNYPHPIVWFPPGYMKDKDFTKPSESYPGAWDMWTSLDTNNLNASRQGGEEKTNDNQHGQEKKMQFPLPIIWMPDHDQPEEVKKDLKEVNANPKVAEELPSKIKIVPVKLLQNENHADKPGLAEDESKSQASSMADKEINLKNIPVKQMEERGEKKPDIPEKPKEETTEKKASILEKQKEESRDKKSSEQNTKKQASPVKSSKLPPVCLRVDPLPRRKTGNGTSRSPTPPGLKEKEKVQWDSKVEGSGGLHESMKGNLKKKETNVIEVEDRSANGTEKEDGKNQYEAPVGYTRDVLGKSDAEAAGMCKGEDMFKEQVGAVEATESERRIMENNGQESSDRREDATEVGKTVEESSQGQNLEEIKEKRKILSDTDAAILIQSAYRGFDVRRWEPLKKLRQIAKVREQVGDIREGIHDLETSPKQQEDEKQRLVLGETIMNLLLQLDTIQGLHPSVREIRKSMARELVFLQVKLDSLTNREAKERTQSGAGVTSMVETSHDHQPDICSISSPVPTESTSDAEESVQTSPGKEAVAMRSSEEIDSGKDESADMPMGEGEIPKSVAEVIEVTSPLPKDAASSEFEESKGITLGVEGLESEDGSFVKPQWTSEVPRSNHEEPDKSSPTEDKADTTVKDLQLSEMDGAGYLGMEVLGGPQKPVRDESSEHPLGREEPADSGDAGQLEQPDPNVEDLTVVPLVEEQTLVDVDEPPMGVVEELESKLEGSPATPGVDSPVKVEESEPDLPVVPLAEEQAPVDVEEPQPTGVVEELESKQEWSAETPGLVETLVKVEETEPASNLGCLELPMVKDGELVSVNKESLVQCEQPLSKQEECFVVPLVEEGDGHVEELMGGAEVDLSGISSPVVVPPAIVVQEDDVNIKRDYSGWSESGADTVKIEDSSLSEHGDNLGISKNISEVDSYKENSEAAPEVCLLPTESTLEQDSRKENEMDLSNRVILPTEPTDKPQTGLPKERDSLVCLVSVPESNHLHIAGTELQNKEKKLAEENEKLNEMLEKLLETGKEQLAVISNLSGRVKDLERKLAQKKKLRVKRRRAVKV